MFLPPIFTDGAATGALPSARVMWVQQGLVTVLAAIDAAYLAGMTNGTGRGGGAGDAPAGAARPAPAVDVDDRTASMLALTLAQVCDVFVPPLEEALGEALDARASRAGERGLEAARVFGVDGRGRTLDVHGTRYGARRPGRGKSANGALVSQAAAVSSADSAGAGDLPAHLSHAVAAAADAVAPPALTTALPAAEASPIPAGNSDRQVARLIVTAATGEDPVAAVRRAPGAFLLPPAPAPGDRTAPPSQPGSRRTSLDAGADGTDASDGGSVTPHTGALPMLLPPTGPWPAMDAVLLATRNAGAVAARRAGDRSTVVVFGDDGGADRRRYDAHVDSDLRELMARTAGAERALAALSSRA